MVYLLKIIRQLLKFKQRILLQFQLYYYRGLYKQRFNVQPGIAVDGLITFSFDISGSSLSIGNKAIFKKHCFILAEKGGTIKIGDNVFFNNGCSINCLQEISIGDNCQFGEAVKFYDHNHRHADKNELFTASGYSTGTIKIGNNCWLGSNVIVLKNVEIGDNCVIGAGCIIFKSIPAGSVIINKQDLTVL